MKKHGREQALAVLGVVLALLVAGCSAAPTPPPPTPTSEVPVSAEEDILGTWQVEGAAGDLMLLVLAKFAKSGYGFRISAGSKELDRGAYAVKEEQLSFVTELKDCDLCKGSYRVYVTKQEGRSARLRFVLNGQDPYVQRAATLNGKTAMLVPGALPGEVPVSTVEDVNGVWKENMQSAASGDPASLTIQNGRFMFSDRSGKFDGGTIVVEDGKLVFDDDYYGDGSYLVFVKRQSGQPVWLRFISTGDEAIDARERLPHGRILPLQPAP
jgi:hypothetical protein